MLNKLQAVVNKYEELCARSEQPDFYADPKKAAKLLREKNDLEPIVESYLAYRQAEQDMADAEELMADPEMKELCQETYAAAKAQKEELFEKFADDEPEENPEVDDYEKLTPEEQELLDSAKKAIIAVNDHFLKKAYLDFLLEDVMEKETEKNAE